jgi:hypothetical protein
VTEEFADTEARINNLKATEAQLLKLLERAEEMEDILVVQRELTGVREQIERLQGRLNVLERRSAFSTISVILRPQQEVKKPEPPTLASPAPNAANVGIRPTFAWSISEGAISYDLQVAKETDTTFTDPLLNLVKHKENSYSWQPETDALEQGVSYRWRVRASNSAGDGDWSVVRAFKTLPAWSPFHVISESWAASLLFLQRLADVVLGIGVFFWWLILPLLVLFVLFRRRLSRPFGRTRPAPAAATAAPSSAPPSSTPPPAETPPTP